jgi:hypothetical protein
MRDAAAAEKAFGERNRVITVKARGDREWKYDAERGFAREDCVARHAVVGRVAGEAAEEAAAGPEVARRETDVEGVEDAAAGIRGIVAAVLCEVRGDESDAHGLQQLWNEQGRDHDVAGGHAPDGVAKEGVGCARELLRDLDRRFLPARRERANVARLVEQRRERDVAAIDAAESRRHVVERCARLLVREPAA